jgi:trans-aconitate methyltransferase
MDEEEIIQPALWSEQNSQQFIDYAEYFVPNRHEQMQIICQLIPEIGFPTNVLELCCGEGLLAKHILEKRSNVQVIGMDGSSAMLWRAQQRLSDFGSRFTANLTPWIYPRALQTILNGCSKLGSKLSMCFG